MAMNSLPRWLISITDMPLPCQSSISSAAWRSTGSGSTAGPALKLMTRDMARAPELNVVTPGRYGVGGNGVADPPTPSHGESRPAVRRSGAQAANDLGGDRQARRQPRRFDAVEVHQSGDAVRLGTLEHEVARGPAGPLQLRPNAAVRRRQRAVLQRRPVAPDGCVERRAAPRIYRVIDRVGRV